MVVQSQFNKSIFTIVSLLTVYWAMTINLSAVPAAPHLITFKQPDGTQFNAYQRGDEYYNWIETEDRYVIVKNQESGYFEYAIIEDEEGEPSLIPSGVVVTPLGVQYSISISSSVSGASEIAPISRKTMAEIRAKTIKTRNPFPLD